MPMASAMRAKRRPIAPRPTTPTVRPSSSTLLCVALSQWPACMRAFSVVTDLAQASSRASACSATAAALAPVAATTWTPRARAADASIVSVPLPCLEMTFRLGAAPIAAAPTLP